MKALISIIAPYRLNGTVSTWLRGLLDKDVKLSIYFFVFLKFYFIEIESVYSVVSIPSVEHKLSVIREHT